MNECKWIPTKEKLPQQGQTVVVATNALFITDVQTAVYEAHDFRFNDGLKVHANLYDYWLPIPPLPDTTELATNEQPLTNPIALINGVNRIREVAQHYFDMAYLDMPAQQAFSSQDEFRYVVLRGLDEIEALFAAKDSEVAALQAKLDRAVEGLRVYADEANWITENGSRKRFFIRHNKSTMTIHESGFDVAQSILSEIEQQQGQTLST